VPLYHDFFDPWGAYQEGTLDANAVAGNAPDGKILVIPSAPEANHHTSEFLDSLAAAFRDAQEDFYRVAGTDFWNVGIIWSLNGFQEVIHDWLSFVNCRIQDKAAIGGTVKDYTTLAENCKAKRQGRFYPPGAYLRYNFSSWKS
jgi:hypothetical protein